MSINKTLVKTGLALSIFLASGLVNPAMAESADTAAVRVKGTRVSIVKPDGFSQAPSFNGFILKEKIASIMITELPAPYDKLILGFTKENFAKKKIDLVKKEEIEVAGRKGLLVNIKQKLGSTVMEKWITIFGDENNSVTVMSTFPEQFSGELSDKMKASVMSATWDPSIAVDTQENLNFTVKASSPFKLARRIQNMLLFSRGGQFPAKKKSDALFLVGESFYIPPSDDKAKFCVKRLKQIRSLTEIGEAEPKPVELDGLKGYAISTSGTDKQTSEKMFVYQVIVFGDKSYFIQQGISRDTEKEETEPLFKKMSESFKLTKK